MRRALPVYFVGLALVAGLASCGETPGRRVAFSARVLRADPGPFAVGDWSVTVTGAELAFGPIWIYADPTASALRLPPLFGPARALAHPGHGDHGDVMAEVLHQRAVDLLAGDVTLGEGAGVTGRWDLFEMMLSPSNDLDGFTARLTASAERGEDTMVFTADVVMDRHVDEIPLGATVDESGGRIDVAVDLFGWVERIDLDALWEEASALDGPVGLAPGSQGHDAVYIGVRSLATYAPTYHPPVTLLAE